MISLTRMVSFQETLVDLSLFDVPIIHWLYLECRLPRPYVGQLHHPNPPPSIHHPLCPSPTHYLS